MIGKLERVPLRAVWPHEALDLTRWLSQHSDVLSEIIDRTITITKSESEAGDFAVDLRGVDEFGNIVLVENQLEKSDHKHLGQLVTYVAALGAKIAIWICSNPRPEHVAAITWLNENETVAFYLLKIEAVKIGSSEPAPLLTLITGPSSELAEAGKEKKEVAASYAEHEAFWAEVLAATNRLTALYRNISPSKYTYLWASAGMTRVGYSFRALMDDTTVEVYLNRVESDQNKMLFDFLLARREEIEREFGGVLEWDEMPGQLACRIRYSVGAGGYRSPREAWPEIALKTAEAMVRLERAIGKDLKEALEVARL